MMERRRIPAFGNWDYSDELPITQYFESAAQAGLIRGNCFGEDGELFKVEAAPVKPVIYHHHHHHHRKVRQGGGEGEKQQQQQGKVQQRKQEKGCGVTAQSSQRKPGRAPKAVDEDLYKIPPELLYQKPKRSKFLKSLWRACLGLNCIT